MGLCKRSERVSRQREDEELGKKCQGFTWTGRGVQLSCPRVGSSVREGSHPGRALESDLREG